MGIGRRNANAAHRRFDGGRGGRCNPDKPPDSHGSHRPAAMPMDGGGHLEITPAGCNAVRPTNRTVMRPAFKQGPRGLSKQLLCLCSHLGEEGRSAPETPKKRFRVRGMSHFEISSEPGRVCVSQNATSVVVLAISAAGVMREDGFPNPKVLKTIRACDGPKNQNNSARKLRSEVIVHFVGCRSIERTPISRRLMG